MGNNKKIIIFGLIIFAGLFLFVHQSLAATYYVDATGGNDINNGTAEATAWKTIAKVNSSTFQPGDSILFKRGEVWREQLTVPSSGAPGNPITFRAYGSGDRPTFRNLKVVDSGDWSVYSGSGANTIYSKSVGVYVYILVVDGVLSNQEAAGTFTPQDGFWAYLNGVYYWNPPGDTIPSDYVVEVGDNRNAIHGSGVSYITIDSIHAIGERWVYNVGDNGIISFSNGSDIIIKNCLAEIGQTAGIRLSGCPNSLINNCEARYTTSNGILVKNNSSHTEVSDNKVHDIGISEPGDNEGIAIAGYASAYSDGIIVTRNEVYNCGKWVNEESNRGRGIILYGKNTNTICSRNKVYNNAAAGIIVQVAEADTSDGVSYTIDHNLIYDTGLFASGPQGIYGGLVIQVGRNVTVNVYNNTIVNTRERAGGTTADFMIWTQTAPAVLTLTAKNNIIYTGISSDIPDFSVRWRKSSGTDMTYVGDNNLIYNINTNNSIGWIASNYTAATWAAATGQDANSIASYPLFVNEANKDFHLQPFSPAINAGVDIGLTTDFAGNPIIGLPDIGAYEYAGAGPLPDITPPSPPSGVTVQ